MVTVKELHRAAMERTDLAFAAQRGGAPDEGKVLLREACELETKAASLASQKTDSEPTRSILYRSAASLALDCGLVREAERLICEALSGDPPEAIAEELRDLLEQAHFRRHLEIRGVELTETEIQMSLAGNSVGLGVAPVGEILSRIGDTEKLLYRTAERLTNKPFRASGQVPGAILNSVRVFTSVPRAGSFAVSLRVGRSTQMQIPGMPSLGEETIADMLDCLELFNQGNLENLEKKIAQPDYYTNFVGLARNIAPDGNDVKSVGFSALRDGALKTVSLTRQALSASHRTELSGDSAATPDPESKVVEIRGFLKAADSRRDDQGKIQIVDAKGVSHALIVPVGMMSDIVKPHWDSEVVIAGDRKKRGVHLREIRPVKPDSM